MFGSMNEPWRTEATMVLISQKHGSDIALVGEDMYSVLSQSTTLGFVYKVGNVFVALTGSDFGRAVEVGQSLSWDRAIEMVRNSS
jgi:hypothetical protein